MTRRPRISPTFPSSLSSAHQASTSGADASAMTTTAGWSCTTAYPFSTSYLIIDLDAPKSLAAPTVRAVLYRSYASRTFVPSCLGFSS